MATRLFGVTGDGDGDVFLLAAADMLLVSLLPRSIDLCRKDDCDLDLGGMIVTIIIVRARPGADYVSLGGDTGMLEEDVEWSKKGGKNR